MAGESRSLVGAVSFPRLFQINKALGLSVPPALLTSADELIE